MQKKTLAACLLLMIASLANGFQASVEWVKFTSSEGRYTALLPQQPKLSSQEAAAATGEMLKQYMAQTTDSNSFYSVAYFDSQEGMTFSFDKARDGMVSAVKGTLLSEDAISLGGHAGRELKVLGKHEGIEIVTRVRVYYIGGRAYLIQHAFQKSSESPAMVEKTAKFFDSFKVTMGK